MRTISSRRPGVALLRVLALAAALAVLGLLTFLPSGRGAATPGTTERVSVASDGSQGNGFSGGGFDIRGQAISADGRYVVFTSQATNLVPGDTNGVEDVFVHDRQTGVTERVSVASDGNEGNDSSWEPAISADGRHVAFWSRATNLVPGDTNGVADVFVHDRQTGVTERASVDSGGNEGNGWSTSPAISADGRYVAFHSHASNLVAGDTNNFCDFNHDGNLDNCPDVFVHDRQTGTTELASVDSGGNQDDNGSDYPAISADGRYVVFVSAATNLVPGDTNGKADVFVRDRQTGVTERVSVDSSGNEANGPSGFSYSPAISADGRYVAFASAATNLVPGDTNDWIDIFVHDRQTGVTERVSVDSSGNQGNGCSCKGMFDHTSAISADGRYVAFTSFASNLVPGDTNGGEDVFVHDRQTKVTELVRVSVDSSGNEGGGWGPAISADGRYVAFASFASNLVPGDTNGTADVFVHDRGGAGAPTPPPTPTPTPTPTSPATPKLELLGFYGGGPASEKECVSLLAVVKNNGASQTTKTLTLSESATYRGFGGQDVGQKPDSFYTKKGCRNNLSDTQTIPAGGTAVFRFEVAHDWEWIYPFDAVTELAKGFLTVFKIPMATWENYALAVVKGTVSLSSAVNWVLNTATAAPTASYSYNVQTAGMTFSGPTSQTVTAQVSPLKIGYFRGAVTAFLEREIACKAAAIWPLLWAPCAIAMGMQWGWYISAFDPVPDYQVLVEPMPVPGAALELLPPGPVRDNAAHMLAEASLNIAAVESSIRAAAADDANDPAWVATQLARSRTFLLQALQERALANSLLPAVLSSSDEGLPSDPLAYEPLWRASIPNIGDLQTVIASVTDGLPVVTDLEDVRIAAEAAALGYETTLNGVIQSEIETWTNDLGLVVQQVDPTTLNEFAWRQAAIEASLGRGVPSDGLLAEINSFIADVTTVLLATGDYQHLQPFVAFGNQALARFAILPIASDSGTATPTPTPTAAVTPTPTLAPTPTLTPTPTPTQTPGGLKQGDVDCDQDVDAVDALHILRYVAQLPSMVPDNCPDVGATPAPMSLAGDGSHMRGDVDCDDDVDAVDALRILRYVAGLNPGQPPGCAPIGS